MAKKLTPKSSGARDGKVVLTMTSTTGREYELEMTVFDVSTLVSGFYAARAEALKQPYQPEPEVMMNLHRIEFGPAETNIGPMEVMRVYVSDQLYQDYAAPAGSDLAQDVRALGSALGRATHLAGPEFQSPKKH